MIPNDRMITKYYNVTSSNKSVFRNSSMVFHNYKAGGESAFFFFFFGQIGLEKHLSTDYH